MGDVRPADNQSRRVDSAQRTCGSVPPLTEASADSWFSGRWMAVPVDVSDTSCLGTAPCGAHDSVWQPSPGLFTAT